MLTTEQSNVVRQQIAMVLSRGIEEVVPEARLIADLGATGEHLKPLRLAIEAVLPVQIEPIVAEVNARTAVDQRSLLTTSSKSQIVEFLGAWPDIPSGPVRFLDLFTVGMMEAMVAKALDASTATRSAEVGNEPLLLSPELTEQVREVLAEVYQLPLDQMHADMELATGTEDTDFDFAHAMIEVKQVLGINFDVEMDLLSRGMAELSGGQATTLTMQRLRRLLPTLDGGDDVGLGAIPTVGLVERICAAAIERRESPEASRSQTRRENLGLYLSNWSWADQDWWVGVPEKLGAERYRMYLIGMLRAAFMESGTIDNENIEILEMAEKFAETGNNSAAMEKRLRTLGNRRKLWRTPYVGALLCILKPVCTPEEGATVLAALEHAFHWTQPQVIAAAHAWGRSLMSPLKSPSDFKAEWCTSEVVALAQRMHDSRAFIEFPQLGHWLKQAGCDLPVVLDHWQNPEHRHLRGDWLLKAILDVHATLPSKSRGKSGGSTTKVKKPKLPAMSNEHKKRFKELLVKERGELPLAAAWSAVWQSDHQDDQVHFRKKCPTLPADALIALGGLYPALRTVWPEVAIVRRLNFQSVVDLPATLTLYARVALSIWHSSPRLYDLADHFRNAFAVGDEAALRWAFHELPCSRLMETDFGNWSYLAFRAIYARDEQQMRTLINRWPYPKNDEAVPPLESVLLEILHGDRAGVTAAMNDLLAELRKPERGECFGAFSLTAHACHRAASWRDPALISDFDVTTAAPWDAEFHAATLASPDPLQDFDFSTTPAQLRDLLLTQAIPPWLRELQSCPQNVDKSVGVLLTDVGSNPDEVYRLVEAHSDALSRAHFDHRMQTLPVTLACAMHPVTSESYREALQKAGATVEIVD